ncbi:hypothetical protein [Rudaea sp.]|uniref:hypothetical protein n=1 Tax=Rudaea sp. TaxID=2136325 RepID=UPI0037851D75
MNWIKIQEIDAAAFEAMHGFAATWNHRMTSGFKELDQRGEIHYSGDFEFRFSSNDVGELIGDITFPRWAAAHLKGSVPELKKLLRQCTTGNAVLNDRRWNFFY